MKQHKTPCKDCPFRRVHGVLGGSEPEVYLGQVCLPNFWLPCHRTPGYQGKESMFEETLQCAGAATFRANIGVNPVPPLLQVPADTQWVYRDPAEFYAHYKGITVVAARAVITPRFMATLTIKELTDRQLRAVARRR
jgi:hypothetical protein